MCFLMYQQSLVRGKKCEFQLAAFKIISGLQTYIKSPIIAIKIVCFFSYIIWGKENFHLFKKQLQILTTPLQAYFLHSEKLTFY